MAVRQRFDWLSETTGREFRSGLALLRRAIREGWGTDHAGRRKVTDLIYKRLAADQVAGDDLPSVLRTIWAMDREGQPPLRWPRDRRRRKSS